MPDEPSHQQDAADDEHQAAIDCVVGASPNNIAAPMNDSSGPVPRAIGYTTDRSECR